MSTPTLETVLQLLRLEGEQVTELIPGGPVEDVDGNLIAMEESHRQVATFAPIALKEHHWQQLSDEAAEHLTAGNRATASRAAADYLGAEDRARVILRALIQQQDDDQARRPA